MQLVFTLILLVFLLVEALFTGIFKGIGDDEFIAFGIHSAAKPHVFSTIDNVADSLNPAPGTVATIAKKQPLEIFVQTRAGRVLHGQLAATQFVAPFFTCVRFKLFADGGKPPWYQRSANRQLRLLPDNIDAEAFRQCRVLLRWT